MLLLWKLNKTSYNKDSFVNENIVHIIPKRIKSGQVEFVFFFLLLFTFADSQLHILTTITFMLSKCNIFSLFFEITQILISTSILT